MAIDVTLPDPPYPSPVVDAGRKITPPWRGWIAEWLRTLAAGLEATDELTTALENGGGPILLVRAELDLGPRPGRGGVAYLEATFLEAQVGAPVLMQVIPPRDEAEGVLVSAVAEVLDGRRMRVRWASSETLAGRVSVHYVIGGTA
jgi:hypothetical protein